MEFIYPAVFHINEDGSFTITHPDLPGCISEGKNLSNALTMARYALSQWLEYLSDKGVSIPQASLITDIVTSDDGDFTTLIRVGSPDLLQLEMA
jgi:predicted RNase H-like HicB family nuclease